MNDSSLRIWRSVKEDIGIREPVKVSLDMRPDPEDHAVTVSFFCNI